MGSARVVGSVGGLMQLVGVGLVFWDIADVERLYHLQPWLRSIRDWLMAPLRWLGIRSRITGRGVVVTPVGASLGIGGSTARISISHGPTLEGRIATIEARLDDVDEDLNHLRSRLREQEAQLARRIRDVEERALAETAAVQQLVKALSADSIRRRLIGGILIVVGTFLTIVALWLPSS
jgi:hypothetical protein